MYDLLAFDEIADLQRTDVWEIRYAAPCRCSGARVWDWESNNDDLMVMICEVWCSGRVEFDDKPTLRGLGGLQKISARLTTLTWNSTLRWLCVKEVIWWCCLSVILLAGYWKKLMNRFHWNLMLWLKELIVFGDDSGSLSDFPHHCGIGDFRRFISISHTVTSRFYDTWRNDWGRQENESTTV